MPLDVFRSGWKPTPESVPRARFDTALRKVTLPASVDFHSKVPVVGMHLNDQWGDCTCAGDANLIQGITTYGLGTEFVVPDSDVLTAYEQTGFDPNAGPPGDNPTDNGWTVQAALTYIQQVGFGGHKIGAFGQVSYTDHTAVMTCLYEFGYASLGVNLPQSAMDQFNAGQTWTVSGDSTIIGGHCIVACGYNATGPLYWTWGSVVQATWAWHDTYVGEFWPVVSQEWINASSQVDPEGVDLDVLGQEFQSAVGLNPFGPSPAPQPSPAPAGPDGIIKLVEEVLAWLKAHL